MTSCINTCKNFSCQEFRAAYRTEFKKDYAQHILIIMGVASYILTCVGMNWCRLDHIDLMTRITFSNPHIAAWITLTGIVGMGISVCFSLILVMGKSCNRMNRPVVTETAYQNGNVN